MTQLFGADIAAMRSLAESFQEKALVLRDAAATISGAVDASSWAGIDAEEFASRWHGMDRASMLTCADALEAAARQLNSNADAQEQASAADDGAGFVALGGAAPAFGAPPDGALPDGALPNGALGAAGDEMPDAARRFRDGLDDMTPQQVHDAWAALTPETREWLITHRPYLIGNLDGIPFADRDTANRNELNRYYNKLQAALAEVRRQWPNEYEQNLWYRAIDRAGLTVEEARSIENLHDQLGTGKGADFGKLGRDGHLIAFDMPHEGATRAAISIGDLDHASHVGVFVPGIDSRIGNGGQLNKYMEEMDALRYETGDILLHTEGSSQDNVAQVFWLDYSAPAGLDDGPSVGTALDSNRAEDGGNSLAGFGDGLEAVNPNARKTVQAHSYGTVTSTYGLSNTDAFDSFVAFGSPGLPSAAERGGSLSYNDLAIKVPENERYFGWATWDWVQFSRWHGRSPESWGFERLPTRSIDHFRNSKGHSQYLNRNTSFQRALAAITAGHPEMVPR